MMSHPVFQVQVNGTREEYIVGRYTQAVIKPVGK